MKLAVACENGRVARYFGQTAECKFYEIEGGEVQSRHLIPVNEGGSAGLVLFLMNHRANALLCGQIGESMEALLQSVGIPVFTGGEGDCDACVLAFLSGALTARSAAPHCDASDCASCAHGCHDAALRDPLADCFPDRETSIDRAPYLDEE